MMNSLDSLYLLQTKLKNEYRFVCKELSRCPQGELKIVEEHNYIRYIHTTHDGSVRKRTAISKNPKLIGKLAHKTYLEEKKARLAENIRLIDSILKKSRSLDVSDILAALPWRFHMLDSGIVINGSSSKYNWPFPIRNGSVPPRAAALTTGGLTPEEWGALPYCENTAFLERKTQLTSRGVACRSKSEVAILEKYDAFHIPYHYDEMVIFGNRAFAPDLIAARFDGTLAYHEHFGLSDPDYRRKSNWKMDLYDAEGIRPGKNLICTYDREDGSINMELIEAQIRDMFFRS